MEKVFCRDCFWLKGNFSFSECTHKSNIERVIVESWYERGETEKCKLAPYKKNKNNDCPNFTKGYK